MSARRSLVRTAVPAIELVRASCSVCHEPALCANLRDVDAPICFACHLSMAQLIASAQRANKRPHQRPCHCEGCVTFDEGQRGEIANTRLLDVDGDALSRWQVLEVD